MTTKSVFYDIHPDDPARAARLTAKAVMMVALQTRIKEQGWTQAEAASALGVSQRTVSDLVNHKLSNLALDVLIGMLPAAGLEFTVRAAVLSQAAERAAGIIGHCDHHPADVNYCLAVACTARTRQYRKGHPVGERVTVTRFDDLDNALDADETVTYSLDGTTYEIDLSDKNAQQLRGEFQKWIGVSRKLSESNRPRRPVSEPHPNGSAGAGLPLAEIRAWAISRGIEVPRAGRVSAAVVREWRAANPGH